MVIRGFTFGLTPYYIGAITMQLYLQFGSATDLPMQTVSVKHKVTKVPFKGRTVTGYGAAIPTEYMVYWADRWRRVYVARWGNAGTAYIGKPGEWIATVDWEL